MATWRSLRCCAATGSRGGTDPAASPTASPPRPASPGFLRAAYLDIGLAPGTSSNSLTGHPAEQVLDLLHQHRKHRIPVLRAGGHSPGTAGNTTTHDDPPHDNPVPPVPRVDGGRMPAPGPDRTPPASGRPIVYRGVAHGGRRHRAAVSPRRGDAGRGQNGADAARGGQSAAAWRGVPGRRGSGGGGAPRWAVAAGRAATDRRRPDRRAGPAPISC